MPWEPLPSNESEPQQLGGSLDRLMDRLAGTSVSAIEVIMDSWPEIVGDAIAGVSAPVKLADATLSVRVTEAELATEIRWMERTIIDRVAELAPGTELSAIKVITRPR